jgi:hypothetical protein
VEAEDIYVERFGITGYEDGVPKGNATPLKGAETGSTMSAQVALWVGRPLPLIVIVIV